MGVSILGRSSAHVPPIGPPNPEAGIDQERWHELVYQVGAEIAGPLTAALERVNTLTSTGTIDRAGLKLLREEIESARQVGMLGQQLTRFASGRIRQAQERIQLADVVQGVATHRNREAAARGLSFSTALEAVEVIVDASLLFSIVNTIADWALANAQASIDFGIDVRTAPVRARLTCRFRHRALDPLVDGGKATVPRGLDSLTWRLIEQTGWAMGLVVERRDESQTSILSLDFPRTASVATAQAMVALDLNDGFAASTNSQPLAGSHVLVVASRRDIRVQIRDSLRHMSLIMDFVNTVEEAVAFCGEGLPHALIIESIQAGERFASFRADILREIPDFVFIEIVEEGTVFEMSGFSGGQMARVGRGVLTSSLPSALIFELAKGF